MKDKIILMGSRGQNSSDMGAIGGTNLITKVFDAGAE